MVHKLKTAPIYFEAILKAKKRFEYRKDDQDFKQGDRLDLHEFNPIKGKLIEANGFTGRRARCLVLSVWRGLPSMPSDFCIMDILLIDEHKPMEVSSK